MSVTIEIRDLPARLNEAVTLAAAGQEVILADSGTPRARLLPVEQPSSRTDRVAGLHAGAIEASPDFDTPLPDEFWSGQP